jgi:ABC-type sugar transport system ATPase subunit
VLVEARGLTKRFGDFTAVDGIDFDVQKGEAFGLLGPNGAGKTSTMRMIGCVSPPTSGSLRILGMDPATHGPAIRARLGVVPQEDTLDLELTVRENLVIYGRYFNLPRALLKERSQELLESPSPAPSSTSPSCCCSTSPRPASTRRPVTCCGTGCGASAARGSPSCSPPTTWTRPSNCATDSS